MSSPPPAAGGSGGPPAAVSAVGGLTPAAAFGAAAAEPGAAVPAFQNLEECDALAKAVLPRMAYDYYAGGAESEATVRDNRAAFARCAAAARRRTSAH